MICGGSYYPPLESGGIYHVYNRANTQFDRLFIRPANYHYFLKLYRRYVSPFAETLAYCLLPDHFHLLIRIKAEPEIRAILVETPGYERYSAEPVPQLMSEVFRRFFIAYAKAFNKQWRRRGSLFQKDFKRKIVYDQAYLEQVLYYIHTNPTHHGMYVGYDQYPWSSYQAHLGTASTFLSRDEILALTGGREGFVRFHELPREEWGNGLQGRRGADILFL